MANGRIGKTELWTSADTGRSVRIRKVSTLLRAEVRRQVIGAPGFEEPQPPTSTVDYGDGTLGHISSVRTRTLKREQWLFVDVCRMGSHIFGSHENTETYDENSVSICLFESHIFGSHENTETYRVHSLRAA